MKQVLIIAMIVLSFGACKEKEKKAINDLTSSKDSLRMVVMMKDSIINDAFNSISEVASSIQTIADREKIVVQNASSPELKKAHKDQIKDNLDAISQLLDQNRKTLSNLQANTKKLKAANVKIDGLEKLVNELQRQLKEKDSQIEELKQNIDNLQRQVATLTSNVKSLETTKTELSQTVAEQTEALNTVYYIVGQEKELKSAGVLDKQGFIGRTKTVGAGVNLDGFIKADKRELERIPINRKRVSVVSSHPADSYMLVVEKDNLCKELVITNAATFWQNSKILVVSYKK